MYRACKTESVLSRMASRQEFIAFILLSWAFAFLLCFIVSWAETTYSGSWVKISKKLSRNYFYRLLIRGKTYFSLFLQCRAQLHNVCSHLLFRWVSLIFVLVPIIKAFQTTHTKLWSMCYSIRMAKLTFYFALHPDLVNPSLIFYSDKPKQDNRAKWLMSFIAPSNWASLSS